MNRRKIWKSIGSNIRSPYLFRVCVSVYVWERQRKNDYANKWSLRTSTHTSMNTEKMVYFSRKLLTFCSFFSSSLFLYTASLLSESPILCCFHSIFTAYSYFFLSLLLLLLLTSLFVLLLLLFLNLKCLAYTQSHGVYNNMTRNLITKLYCETSAEQSTIHSTSSWMQM